MPATETKENKREQQRPPAKTPAPAPATPAPTVPPKDQGVPPPKSTFRGLDEDLAEAFGQKETPLAPQPSGEKPSEPSEPAPPPAEDDDYLMGAVAPKETPATESATATPPEQAAATGPLKAPELRKEYARVKQRLADVEKELANVKAKGGEVKSVDDAERKGFIDQITTLKKQLEQSTATLKTVAYEQSDEYKEKYEQPFIDAWQEGAQLVSRLSLQDEEGNTRKGTHEDFQRIMSVADDEQAANLAQEMFGSNAFYVLSSRRDLQRLHHQRVKALDEHKANFSEKEKNALETAKKQAEEREAQRIQNTALFQKLNSQAAEKYPELFAPVPGDDEGNALLARGYKDADLAFTGAPDLPNDRRVALHSAIRNRAAAFGRLVHQLKTKDAEIAELQKELEDIKGSTPGPGQVTREEHTPKRPSIDEELEAVAKRLI